MASLESKLLDGKTAGYCSSSEGEEEDIRPVDDDKHQERVMRSMQGSANTGAKGVLADYDAHKRMESRKAQAQASANREKARQGTLEQSAAEREAREIEEADEALAALRLQRMQRLSAVARGRVAQLISKASSNRIIGDNGYAQDQVLSAIEETRGILLLLLYREGDERTAWATELCRILASSFPIRVARVTATTAGMSPAFETSGVPCLQVYYRGEVATTLVQLHSHVGEDGGVAPLLNVLRTKRVCLKTNTVLDEDEETSDDEQ